MLKLTRSIIVKYQVKNYKKIPSIFALGVIYVERTIYFWSIFIMAVFQKNVLKKIMLSWHNHRENLDHFFTGASLAYAPASVQFSSKSSKIYYTILGKSFVAYSNPCNSLIFLSIFKNKVGFRKYFQFPVQCRKPHLSKSILLEMAGDCVKSSKF